MIMRVLLLSILFLAGLIGVKVYSDAEVKKGSDGKIFILELVIVGIAVYFNLLLAIMWRIGDITDFANMMKRLMNGGFFGLYQNGGIVYPPLFQYLFFVIAKILQWMGIPFDSRLRIFTMSVKLPCILCVFIMAWMIWQTVRKYAAKEHESVVLYLCLLNPGYLLITAVVCQVDALYTCLMLLTVYLIINQKLKWSYFAFAGAILLKFQAVFLTPVIAFAVINEVCLKNFSWKRFFGELLAGLSAIACIALSYIPFVYDFKTGNWTNGGFSQNFSSTIVGFGKASQNAYNFWTLVGYNEIPISTYFGPFTCDTWNKIFIVLLVALCSFLFWKKEVTEVFIRCWRHYWSQGRIVLR